MFGCVLVEISTALTFWSLRQPSVHSMGQAEQTAPKIILCLCSLLSSSEQEGNRKQRKGENLTDAASSRYSGTGVFTLPP